MTFEITDDSRLLLLNMSDKPKEISKEEYNDTAYRVIDIAVTGRDKADHHGAKHTGGIPLKYVEIYSILTLALHIYAIIKGAYKIIFAKKCIYVDIFLYLCALEFLPIAIVWKTILQLGDFITIKI